MPDLPTLALVAVIILAAAVLLWLLFMVFVVRRVARLQDRIMDEVLSDDDPPRHYGRTPRADKRRTHEDRTDL